MGPIRPMAPPPGAAAGFGGMGPGPAAGPGISFEKMAGPAKAKGDFAQHLGEPKARTSAARETYDRIGPIEQTELSLPTPSAKGRKPAAGTTEKTPKLQRPARLLPNVKPRRDFSNLEITSAQKLKGDGSKKQVLWSDEKLAGPINPDSLDTKKRKVDRTLAGRNPNVNYSRAGRALDPFTNESMEKGRPVPAQSMTPLAQGARQFSQSVDDVFLPNRGKKATVSKQKLAGKKGDEGLPFVGKSKRKAGMGDEGMPLAKKKPAMKKKGKM